MSSLLHHWLPKGVRVLPLKFRQTTSSISGGSNNISTLYSSSSYRFLSNRQPQQTEEQNIEISKSKDQKDGTRNSGSWGHKKITRYKPLYVSKVMAELDPTISATIEPLRLAVKEQGDLVRRLKSLPNTDPNELSAAITELLARKSTLERKELELAPPDAGVDRLRMEALIRGRFYYDNSFSLYGDGMAGQFDLGPIGCALQQNIIHLWRGHFILPEQMLEIDAAVLTPETVLKASGHVAKFDDLMVKDLVTGDCFRLDHLLKEQLEKFLMDRKTPEEVKERIRALLPKLDSLAKEELAEILQTFQIKSPTTGNQLSEPESFNLMFSTSIGPSQKARGYLRPETAQGIFVNFKNLFEFAQKRIPFAVAQVGRAFRNEISPKSGLLRVREFTLAEIEHFFDPNSEETQRHPKFASLSNLQVRLLTSEAQLGGQRSPQVFTLKEALDSKLISSETFAFYLGRIQEYLIKIGIDPERLRFRQHLPKEMAHYASECWDAECLTSYGWVECVGLANRSCYDLSAHAEAAKQKLTAVRSIDGQEFVPTVIEPSFGIGRLLYTVLEHRFRIRENDPQRTYFALPASIAPVKCSILPLNATGPFEGLIQRIVDLLVEEGISFRVEDGRGAIGRRYTRTDELAVPFAITIDYDTEKDDSVTVRERDSMEQVRVKISDVPDLINKLIRCKILWSDLSKQQQQKNKDNSV